MDKDKSSYGNMNTRQRAASKKKKKKCPFYRCDSVSYCTYIFSLISFACPYIYLLVVVADEGRWGNGVRVCCPKSPDLTNDNHGEENSLNSTRDEQINLGTLPPVSSPVKTNSVSKALSVHQKRS